MIKILKTLERIEILDDFGGGQMVHECTKKAKKIDIRKQKELC